VKTIYRDKGTNRLITRQETQKRDPGSYDVEIFSKQAPSLVDDYSDDANEERLIQSTAA